MKKLTFLLLAGIFSTLTIFSQTLPDNWTGDTDIDTYQESTNVHGGTYSCQVDVNSGTQGNTDMRHDEISVTAGDTYTYSLWVWTSAHVKARVVLEWTGANITYGNYSNAGTTDFEELVQTGTVPTGATGVKVGYRFYDQADFVAGETQYIDDVTFESPTGTPISLANGNMESWPVVTGPEITNITYSPGSPTSSDAVTVTADVTDDGSVSTVECNWGTTDGGPYPNTIEMFIDAGTTYETDTDITAQSDGTTVYFEIEATDDEAETTTSSQQSYTVNDPATATLPYSETFDSDLGDCYPYSVAGINAWQWASITKENSGHAYMNGWGGSNPEEDWLILPGIDFDAGTDEIMQFYTYQNYGNDDADNYLKLVYSSDYTGVGDPTGATWTELTYVQASSTDTWMPSGVVDLSGITGTAVYIAFKYYSTGAPRSWRVDDIDIVVGELIDVNFQVNMEEETVSGDGVHVAGSFQGWLPNTTELILNGTTGYHEVTVSLYAGIEYQFKYLNGNAWGTDEVVPANCQAPGTSNRFEVIGATDYSIDPVCFSSCTDCGVNLNYDITFQVDMQNEIVSGDGVYLAGSFTDWGTNAIPMLEDGTVWSTTVSLEETTMQEYKFVNGDPNNGGAWESIANRSLTVPSENTTLDLVCFNSYEACPAPNAWINEFHYDNNSTDIDESVEIVIENAGDYNLASFQLDLYNGNGGVVYGTHTIDGFTEGDTEGNYTIYYKLISGIQNGPDGFALSYNGTLIPGQFISYEGSFDATDGPASGETSTDIGVSESGSTQIGESLQLKGGGSAYSMFYWVAPDTETSGSLNNSQFFGANYTTWTGTTNNDWTDASNWNNGVADATSNVIIPTGLTNYPTLSAAGYCIDLMMESNASLVGVNYLTVSGNATIERTIEGYTDGTDGFHFLSSPVASFNIAGSDFEPALGTDDFFSWDETTNTWLNWYEGMGQTGNFEVGTGYLVAYNSTNPGSFTGSLNNASVPKSLSFSPGQGDGWNLLGNPFPSAIDWDLLTKTAGVDGTVYVLSGYDNTYVEWNGTTGTLTDGHIPINNGFFIKAGTGSETVTMDPADQVHGVTGFLKAGNEPTVENTLVVSIANEEFINNTYIQFRPDGTTEFDNAIDAYKLFGSSDAPQLFTFLSDIEYSINCLPFTSEEFQLSMGFRNRVASEYTISANGLESFTDQDFEVFLEDIETGDLVNLEITDYSFIAEDVDYNDRFILHFYGVTSVDEAIVAGEAKIYSAGQNIYINFEKTLNNGSQVEIYNTIGQQIYAAEIAPSILSTIRLNEKPGIYIVKLKTETGLTTQKVMIK